MNPQDPLAALNPLRDPALIAWWPLAPGWWVVIVLCLLAIACVCYILIRRYRANAYRRQALKQLGEIRAQCGQTPQDAEHKQSIARQTNALVKAVALRVYPRHDIAALSGNAWQQFLNKTGASEKARFPDGFAKAAYQRNCNDLNLEQLFTASEHWIKKHRPAP